MQKSMGHRAQFSEIFMDCLNNWDSFVKFEKECSPVFYRLENGEVYIYHIELKCNMESQFCNEGIKKQVRSKQRSIVKEVII